MTLNGFKSTARIAIVGLRNNSELTFLGNGNVNRLFHGVQKLLKTRPLEGLDAPSTSEITSLLFCDAVNTAQAMEGLGCE